MNNVIKSCSRGRINARLLRSNVILFMLLSILTHSISLAQLEDDEHCLDLDISFFKSYGATVGEQGNAALQLENGNIATGMQLSSPDGGGIVYPGLLLTDPAGNKIFCKKYTGIAHPSSTQHLLANDKGFLLAGVSWVMQTDSAGEFMWMKDITIGTHLWITDIIKVDGGYMITGPSYTDSSSYPEIACTYMDENGELIWSTQIDTEDFQLRDLRIIQNDQGFLIAGTGKRNIFLGILILQTDHQGNALWSKYYDSTYDDELVDLLYDDGEFYLVGRNYSIDSEWDVFMLTLNEQGDLIESLHLDGDPGDERARCATLLGENMIAISFDQGGSSNRSPVVVALNREDHSVEWSSRYVYEPQFTNYVLDMVPSSNEGLILVGDMHKIGRIRDTYLVRTDPIGNAGCHTSTYPLFEIEKDLEVTDSSYAESHIALLSSTDLFTTAEDAIEITAFNACENIPPCALFDSEQYSYEDCEEQCMVFSDRSSFSPQSWEWTFESAEPSSYQGSHPPPVCWDRTGNYTVQLVVSSPTGIDSIQHLVTVDLYCPPEIPNVFSPNDDQINDLFFIENLPEKFRLTIYNRWGREVFLSENVKRFWDGRVNGSKKDASEGIYFYELLDLDRELSYSGNVHLVR